MKVLVEGLGDILILFSISLEAIYFILPITGVVAHPVVVSFNTFLEPRHPLFACTKMLSLEPAVTNRTFIFNPLLPLSITAPEGIVQLYDVAPVTATVVYLADVNVPTIGQIVVVPVSDDGADNTAVIVAVTVVLVADTHDVVIFFAVA